MVEVIITQPTKVNVKTMKICLKIRDEFIAEFYNDTGDKIADYDGYVPSFMPGSHCGDYVMLDIDLASGRIINWKDLNTDSNLASLRDIVDQA